MIYLSSDHAGYKLKQAIKVFLQKNDYKFVDLGPETNAPVDWPDFGAKAAEKISEEPNKSKAIVICGSGLGMSMVSNKYKNVRAALCHNRYLALMSRKHNNANVLNLGARVISQRRAIKIVKVWLTTEFAGERHQKRLDILTKIEKNNFK